MENICKFARSFFFTGRPRMNSADYAVARCCQSVCLYVTRRSAKRIVNFFLLSVSHTIPYQTGWQYSDGNPHNGGVECKGYEKIMIFDQYLALLCPRQICGGVRRPSSVRLSV